MTPAEIWSPQTPPTPMWRPRRASTPTTPASPAASPRPISVRSKTATRGRTPRTTRSAPWDGMNTLTRRVCLSAPPPPLAPATSLWAGMIPPAIRWQIPPTMARPSATPPPGTPPTTPALKQPTRLSSLPRPSRPTAALRRTLWAARSPWPLSPMWQTPPQAPKRRPIRAINSWAGMTRTAINSAPMPPIPPPQRRPPTA